MADGGWRRVRRIRELCDEFTNSVAPSLDKRSKAKVMAFITAVREVTNGPHWSKNQSRPIPKARYLRAEERDRLKSLVAEARRQIRPDDTEEVNEK